MDNKLTENPLQSRLPGIRNNAVGGTGNCTTTENCYRDNVIRYRTLILHDRTGGIVLKMLAIEFETATSR